jgi:hypothetical protein
MSRALLRNLGLTNSNEKVGLVQASSDVILLLQNQIYVFAKNLKSSHRPYGCTGWVG